jgi:putative membrane protein
MFALSCHAVLAHFDTRAGDLPQSVAELVRSWSFEPGITVPLLLTALLYARGTSRLWKATRVGRGIRWGDLACFVGGWFSLVLALVSPLHAWGNVLFAAHMTQHEVLMLVSAPLLVLGRPLLAMLWGLPGGWAPRLRRMADFRPLRQAWHYATAPFGAWMIHAIVLWSWHLPALFRATLHSDLIHSFQHLSFLGSALLFWWAVIHGRSRAAGFGVAVIFLFTTALHSGLLGALLTFAPSAWYPEYLDTAPVWGLTAVQDQQLGGMIMWIPAGLVYIFAGLAFFAGWLREAESRSSRLVRSRPSATRG